MGTRRFIIILALCFVVYFISDYFFNNGVLYLLGGVIWGSLENISLTFGIILGCILLAGSTVLFFKLQKQFLKYLVLFIVAILLYIFDFILLELVSYDSDIQESRLILNSNLKSNLFLIFRILYKSLILSSIIYFDNKIKVKKSTH